MADADYDRAFRAAVVKWVHGSEPPTALVQAINTITPEPYVESPIIRRSSPISPADLMKATDCRRALMLVEALAALDEIDARLEKGIKPNDNGEPCCELLVGRYDEEGGEHLAYAYLPPEYAKALVPIAREMLRSELKSLGVDPHA